MMKRLIYTILFSLIAFNSTAQDYDLIKTAEGVQIACKIDSITDSGIYFKMMENYKWIPSKLKSEDVIDFKYKELQKKEVIFKTGTSIIEEFIVESNPITSVKNIYKNTVSFELAGNGIFFSLNYDRLIPVSKNIGFDFRLGYGVLFNVFIGEYSILIGGPKHFIETGIGCSSDFQFYSLDIRTGYRFQGKNGLMLRAAPLAEYNKFNDSNRPWSLWYGVAIGYSF